MMRLISCLLLFCLAGSTVSFAGSSDTISMAEVLTASQADYPKISESLAAVAKSKADNRSAIGAFDTSLEASVKSRLSGYYSGDYAETRLVQPIAPAGASVYAGYRIADGNFPIYDDALVTNENGEYQVGVIFSLLRGRIIDERRTNLKNAKNNIELAEAELLLTKLMVQNAAWAAYMDWVQAGKSYLIYKDLYDLAQDRQNQFRIKVKAGDAPNIMLVENEQNLVKREAVLNEAKAKFEQASAKLHVFYQLMKTDELANIARVPREMNYTKIPDFSTPQYSVDNIALYHPEKIRLNLMSDTAHNNLQLAKNDLLPKLDVSVEGAQDIGDRYANREDLDVITKMKFSVPLQRNFAKGKVTKAEADIKSIDAKEEMFNRNIRAEVEALQALLKARYANIILAQKEASLAKKMQNAERDLLEHGASSLFLVNSREQKYTQARIKSIKAQLDYMRVLGAYYAATLQREKFYLR